MRFHIVNSTKFDLELFSNRASLGNGPRHTVWQLKETLNAQIHQPDTADDSLVKPIHQLLAKLVIGRPRQWVLAERILQQTGANDVIFCGGEDAGLPLAVLSLLKRDRPRLVMNVMCPERWRPRLFLQVLQLHRLVHAFLVNTAIKQQYLSKALRRGNDSVFLLPEQTDVQFFYPGAGTMAKQRPLIASGGLEQRDYTTLAAAVKDLDVDVKVCAVSPNATSKTKCSIPETLPDNMEMRHFDWVEFRDLYRSADITVISLLDNNYSAGLTVLMEAMACRRPIVITKTEGLAKDMLARKLVWGVEPGDAEGLKATLSYLLAHPEEAQAKAESAYRYFLEHHTSEHFVAVMLDILQQVGDATATDGQLAVNPKLV
ncbi:MAG TPA: glycosyltransferase [Nodosilinea sp.]|nr:glycosyltransferase [Nodosilinea sp.]